jgi:hypothetical protein
MSFELVTRTLGVLTCLYTVAYFITTMSVAALDAVTYNSGPMCNGSSCVTVARERRILPGQGRAASDEPLWMAASFLTDH